jgi:hypothetical protein
MCQKTDRLVFPMLWGRTLFYNLPTIHGLEATQVLVAGAVLDDFYPIKSDGDATDGLFDHVKEVSEMWILVLNGSKE